MLGKTYWKNDILPGVLYASSILTWRLDMEGERRTTANRKPGVRNTKIDSGCSTAK